MTSLSPADRYPTIVAVTGLVTLAVLTLLLAGAPLYTEDLWWHLKAGEMYATDGPWPESDWMLHTAAEDAPVQHEWLFGVIVHGLEGLIGFHGLRAVHAIAVALIIWLAFSSFRRESRWMPAACLATCVFVVLAWFRLFQFRPDLISIFATLLTYRLLLEERRAPSWTRVALFVALIALWANMHSLFLVSLNLLIAALLGLVLEACLLAFLAREPGPDLRHDPERRAMALRLGTALLLGLAAAALNPRGLGQHLTFFSSTADTAIWHVTDEWSHFNPFDYGANHKSVSMAMWLAEDAVLLAFSLCALRRFARFLKLRSAAALAQFDPVGFGVALAGVVATLISIRFFWMSVFPLLYVLNAAAGWRAARPRHSVVAAWLLAAACIASAAWFSVGAGLTNLMNRFGTAPLEYLTMPYRTHKFHIEGVAFLRESGVRGNLFNTYGMGGFLGYWLAPDVQTFIDSRTEHYGSDVYLDYSAVVQMLGARDGESFLDVVDRRHVDLFFGIGFPGWWHPVFTTPHLEGVPGWLLVSRSFRHAIYLRNDARNRQNLMRIAAYYEARNIPFDRERGLDPGAVIAADPPWAIAHAMLPSDYPALLAASRDGDARTRLDARNALGLVYLLVGAYDTQVAWDRATARAFSEDLGSRRRLLYGLLRLGRVEAARSAMDELSRVAPDDPWTRRLRQLVDGYAALEAREDLVGDARSMQIHKNFLLWKHYPTVAWETWAVEHATPTESLWLSSGAD